MPGELVPILIVISICAYLGWRRYLHYQERIAALQRGSTPRRSCVRRTTPRKRNASEPLKTTVWAAWC